MTDNRGHRAAVFASFLGWTLDAFDFFIVTLTLTAIGKEFGKTDAEMALTISMTLMFRPVGAFIFGLMADRYGRRLPLMIDLVFFAIVEVASGFAPNYTTFLVLRALFGIGMGGEWGVGTSLVMEKAPTKNRGIISGLLQEGYATGNLLAAGCYFLVFPHWGWRPMFFIGGLPALLAVFVRYRVTESEVWEKTKRTDWSGLVGEIFSHWKLFLGLVLLMTMMGLISHGTQDLYPTFLKRDWHFTAGKVSALTAFSMVGAITGGIAFGWYSDRHGRKRAIVTALVLAVLMVPLWGAWIPQLWVLVVGAFLMQFMIQGAWGVIPVHLSELSPDALRGFFSGFAYQTGVAIAGLLLYFETVLAQRTSYTIALSATAGLVCSLGAVVVWLGREKAGIVFGGQSAG